MITNVELSNALRSVSHIRECSRHRILTELYGMKVGTGQRTLVERLNIRPATVSEQLEILIQEGYVRKSIDQKDKRVSVISLTERGILQAQSMIKEREVMLDHMFSNLSQHDKETLYDLLKRIQL